MTPRSRCLGLALVALLAGCGESRIDPDGERFGPPHATSVLRNPVIRIADRADIDIRVSTPPGRSVLRPEPPTSLAGFEILEWQLLPTVHEPQQWIHTQRVRLRAREIGRFEWPALQLRVADPDGAQTAIALPAIPLEVRSILGKHPGRRAPFGARAAPEPTRTRSDRARWPAAAGALLALAAVAALVRGRRRGRAPATSGEPPPAPWTSALAELDCAAALAPALAGHRTAATLRSYMDRRFRAHTRSRTTEELAVTTPPYGATSRWPTFVALLQDLDALRFRPGSDSGGRARTVVDAALARARDFVEATTPPTEPR